MIYYISENIKEDRNAGSKARNDVDYLLNKKYSPIYSYYKKHKGYILRLHGLHGELKHISSDDYLIIQYPLLQFNFIKNLIPKFKNCIIIVHDLNNLRFGKKEDNEIKHFFNHAKYIISHNYHMTKYLQDNGCKAKIVNLNIFDYLIPKDIILNHKNDDAFFALLEIYKNLNS